MSNPTLHTNEKRQDMMDADAMYKSLMVSLENSHQWGEKGRKRAAKKAIALGLVDNMAQFIWSFPLQPIAKTRQNVAKQKSEIPQKLELPHLDRTSDEERFLSRWERWYMRYHPNDNRIHKVVLDSIDLDDCVSERGTISNVKVMEKYFEHYGIMNRFLKKIWLPWAENNISEKIDGDVLDEIDFVMYGFKDNQYSQTANVFRKNQSVKWEILERYHILKHIKNEKVTMTQYGNQSQRTRKEWGSAYRPARG